MGVLKQIQKDKGTTVLLTNTQECDILSQEDLKQGEGMGWVSEWEIFSKAELERAAGVGVRASPVSIKKKGTVLTTQGHNGSEGVPGPAQQWTVVQSACVE